MQNYTLQKELVERLYWLIRLRWIAVLGVFLAIMFSGLAVSISLPVRALYVIASFLGLYNAFFFVLVRRRNSASWAKDSPEALGQISLTANAQIALDLLTLAALIHLSGGIENPFIFYFLFHISIAGILLSRRAAFFQATFSVFLFCLVAGLEYARFLPHHNLTGFITDSQHNNPVYVLGVSFVFVSTLYIAVYLTTSISARLRKREELLREANEQLKEKDRIKSEYVLRVSHDIKEHLAAIQACLEPVSRGITGELNPKQLDLIDRAANRTSKLLFFVKALLEFTRIKLNKEVKMDYFSLKDMLSEAISYVSSRAQEKNISLNSIVAPNIEQIMGSREYIQEGLINILANSVKYTPRNGGVDIRVSDKGNRVSIEIVDNGIGIPKDELPRIFEEFYRASNARKIERDGTGLGLSIAKQIVELHSGKIWVESEEGKGSTFHVELPK